MKVETLTCRSNDRFGLNNIEPISVIDSAEDKGLMPLGGKSHDGYGFDAE